MFVSTMCHCLNLVSFEAWLGTKDFGSFLAVIIYDSYDHTVAAQKSILMLESTFLVIFVGLGQITFLFDPLSILFDLFPVLVDQIQIYR